MSLLTVLPPTGFEGTDLTVDGRRVGGLRYLSVARADSNQPSFPPPPPGG